MTNPLARVALALARRERQGMVVHQREHVAPYRAPGYKEPERMAALDYLTPRARWPLVWLLDIGGFDAVASRASGQATFTLSGAHDGRAGVRLTCNVPLHEGRLFDKEGTYVVVAIPAADEERVAAILRMAGANAS